MLVVDDNSPDGTGDQAEELAAGATGSTSCTGAKKGGLGPAYLAGFDHALRNGYSHILEMDCDLSHPPEALPRMLEASADADLVLGSRYVEGGAVAGWPLSRRVISRGGCLYARTILGVRVNDLTGGFKCFRRWVLESLDLADVHAGGLRLPDRAHLSHAAPGRAGRRGADHVHRPHGRQLEDEPLDRRRGGVEGARAAAPEHVRPAGPPSGAGTGGTAGTLSATHVCGAAPRHDHQEETPVSPAIVEVSDATFQNEVETSNTPVVVDFWAPWCGPCRVMDPILDELAEQHQGKVKFTKMNVDDNPDTAARFEILSIPTVMVFESGDVQKKLIGAVPRRRLEDELSTWLQA